MRRFRTLLALAAVAGPAAAQTPPPATQQVQVKIDVSPAGQAVIKKYLGTPDPAIVQGVNQLRAVGQQMAALADAPKLDLGRLQALLRQQEGIQSALQRRGNDRTLAMLGQLSEADRLKFVRGLRAGQAAARPPAAK